MTEVDQPPILVGTGDIQERLPRSDFLMDVLNRKWTFEHRGTDLIYLPIQRDASDASNVVFGRIGKRVITTENAGPDDEFETLRRDGWLASNVAVNTDSSSSGQMVAFEEKGKVGKPLSIFNSLSNHINEILPDSGWYISVNQIIERQSFWEAVDRHTGEITRAEFTYVTPNVLGITSKINERLKEYRDKENAQSVTVVLNEPKGRLKLDTQEVKDAVDYTSQGGGSAKLKAGRKTVFDSTDDEKALGFSTEDETAIDTPEGRSDLVTKLFRDG